MGTQEVAKRTSDIKTECVLIDQVGEVQKELNRLWCLGQLMPM
jgi:hypothetical protein